MRRLLGRVKPSETAVSEGERELFGGALRYDAGWADHEYARLDLTLWSAVRAMPRLVGAALQLAWQADRRALKAVGIAETGQGITAALGFVVVSQVLGELLGSGSATDRLRAALPSLAVGCLVAVVGAVLASWSTSAAGRLEPKVERVATERYLEAARRAELEAVEDGDFRRQIETAKIGVLSVRRMTSACVATINGLLSLVAAAGVLTVLHPVLLPMLLLIAAPRGWGAMRVAQRRFVSMMAWVEHVRAARLLADLLTSRSSAPEVRVHGVGDFLLGHYRGMAESSEEELTRLAKDKALTELLAAGLSGIAALCTYTAMGFLIMAGQMDLAIAGTAVIAVRSGSASLGALVMNVNQLHEEALYVNGLHAFLAEAERRAIPKRGKDLPPGPLPVRLEKVTLCYPGRDAPAVNEVSLTIPVGSVVALVGENGSGKSSLVKILTGLMLPTAGRLAWGDVDLAEADREQVFDRVALLTQDFERWPLTAATNIRVGRPAHPSPDTALEEAARYSGADKVVADLPHGMNTLLARMFRGASELSGGQWQKFGLSRTHFRNARFLVVDEPTSALDPQAEIDAFDQLRSLGGQDRSVVLVTHRMSGVRHADIIFVLHEGRLVESGDHATLMANSAGRYRAMYEVQAAQYGHTAPPSSTPTAARAGIQRMLTMVSEAWDKAAPRAGRHSLPNGAAPLPQQSSDTDRKTRP